MLTTIHSRFIFLTLLLPITGFAAPDWSLCSVPVVTRPLDNAVQPSFTEIEADQLFSTQRNFLEFSGNVQLTQGEQKLSADQLKFDRESRLFSATGQLSFSDQLLSLKANTIEIDDANNTAVFEQAEFQILENHLRGSADKIIQLDLYQRELYDVSYTTCDPQQNSWSLNASKLRLNQQDGRGTALHAVLRIKDIPVFYFPWFQFPIDNRRMSGLLNPTLSSSNKDGTQLSLPFYWNQAENYDMTLTPTWYSKRGTQLNTENRYLFSHHQGQLNLSTLDDQLVDHQQRWYGRWTHQADLTDNLQSSILIQKVSDSDFVNDFEHIDTVEDVDYLKSSVTFSSQLADWSAQILFEQFQIVNDQKTIASSPYKRLPRLSLNRTFSSDDSLFSINWKNEWVRFDKDEGITGDRLHINPIFSSTFEDSYYFVNPALQLNFTSYELDNDSDNSSLERSLPLFSLDSGLIFERQASSTRNWTQTLEPRLYFLYVPYEDQSEIPDFDSSLLADSYHNLFVNNRFSGIDRIGDTQQISLGITTRLLDKNNRQLFSASIGQAYYVKDRKVSLNSTIDDRSKSNLMTVINFTPEPQWKIQLSSVYDQLEKESTQTDISIRRHTSDQIFNVEYHLREEELEQTTVSFVYPISLNWNVFAKQQLSLIYDKPVQNLFGLAYESCCWGFKMLYEESSDDDFTETDRAVYFQLTLKGLSSAGKDINYLLEDGILGYQPVF